jgi:DNA primase
LPAGAASGQPCDVAGFIAPATLEQIRAASDIVDVIGAALPLKRAGANFVALCPFHKEKSPSFNVNPHRQIFHCFGCHKGGDVFTFVREYEGLNFVDAVRRLAERANIPLEFDQQPGAKESRHLKDTLLQMHEQITQRWQAALANDAAGQIARDYLAQRGVSDEAVKLFRLGYAPDAWDDTVNWARSKGHDPDLVLQAGLILKKEDTGRYYDRFRGRLMFPICDEQGRVIAFSGRVLAGDEKTAKYVNSPETPIFTKGKVFYGLDKSKRAIHAADCAVLCEGQLDLIACFMAGVQNVVAAQGTAFTADHARVLKRHANEVVLCLDSDSAGRNAAVRAFDSLLASGLAIRVATVPTPHDPDSFIKENGGEAFAALIGRAEGFFDFYLNHLCATNDPATDRGRLAIARDMAQTLRKTGSAVLLDTYAQKTAHRLAVSPDAVRTEFRQAPQSVPARAEPDADATPAAELPPPPERELWLLRFALQADDAIEWLAAHLDTAWLQHDTVRRILLARLAAREAHAWRGVPGLIDDFAEDPHAQSLISRAVAQGAPREDLDKQLAGSLRELRNAHADRRLAALRLEIARPDLAPERSVEIVREQAELRRLKQQPLEPSAVPAGEPF